MTKEKNYIVEGKHLFKVRSRIKTLTTLLFFLAFPLGLITTRVTKNPNMGISVIIVIISFSFILFFWLNYKYWKCPKCESRFKMREGSMDRIEHCPYCGIRLRN